MNILVTAGNTQTPVDRVRCITNIFSGRTGAQVASSAFERGHTVALLTSHPEVLDTLATTRERTALARARVRAYRTFDDLDALMRAEITTGGYDAVIHAAAVSDYHVAGVFTHRDGQFEDATAGKVKSSHPELWLKLTPAPKLIDKVRAEWGFAGKLVKFKLEVGVSAAELEEIAERSRVHSRADLMVANTLEGMRDWALIGAGLGGYQHIARTELAAHLLAAVEVLPLATNQE
ncbi:Coenzyme A biosynthesis bifunctional protein CoaBC [Gemmata sp. SH-PL17]|uniref:phosphopantothenoylcysteine decarboxylase domain-containing protein n=1 Tax=Gemmata sp. SH-PL17 TaxID=1630693 RepID=UPI00078DD531|nr:phosphopantothenoylcysteine decarboxylase [Gemmata sp. SH-PL17]AMV28516.1 Coenzyme A biosynthesis bifunctional protein CoaBC [Gemmata sp. SH-PL17]